MCFFEGGSMKTGLCWVSGVLATAVLFGTASLAEETKCGEKPDEMHGEQA